MTDLFKHGLILAMGFSIGLLSVPETALAQASSENAVWTTQNMKADLDSMLNQVGMRAGGQFLKLDYWADSNVKKVFTRNQALRNRMPKELPNDFESIVLEIEQYIDKETRVTTEDQNEVSHNELSRRIVKASFCFGTDPKMAAAKIRLESVFAKKAKSPTGAIGLSQLTGIAIQEVTDQLGGRGTAEAPQKHIDYFRSAIRCYLGKNLKFPWTVGINRINKKMTEKEISLAKKWIQKDIDRDLIYGHALLKLYLAVTKKASAGMLDNYADAFIRYNGDNAKVGKTTRKHVYSKTVMGFFQNIFYSPDEDNQLFVPSTRQEIEEFKAWDDVIEI